MTADVAVLLLGRHSLGFALFHLAFWKLFAWPRTLQSTTHANRAIIQIATLHLVWVFFGMAAACALLPEALLGSRLGRVCWGSSPCSGLAGWLSNSSFCASTTGGYTA